MLNTLTLYSSLHRADLAESDIKPQSSTVPDYGPLTGMELDRGPTKLFDFLRINSLRVGNPGYP